MKILEATFDPKTQWIAYAELAKEFWSQIFSVFNNKEKHIKIAFFIIKDEELWKQKFSPKFLQNHNIVHLKKINLKTAIEKTDEESPFGKFLREIDLKKKRKIRKYSRFQKLKDFFIH